MLTHRNIIKRLKTLSNTKRGIMILFVLLAWVALFVATPSLHLLSSRGTSFRDTTNALPISEKRVNYDEQNKNVISVTSASENDSKTPTKEHLKRTSKANTREIPDTSIKAAEVTSTMTPGKDSSRSPGYSTGRMPGDGYRTPDDGSEELPLRGPGDSHLPFEDRFVPLIKEMPQELAEEPEEDFADPKNQHFKKILLWNDIYSDKTFNLGYGREPFIRARCRVNTCLATGNRTRYKPEEVDALLWHFRASDRSLPEKRSPHTRYVFWMMESASYLFGNLEYYHNIFNWTFTYRLDSDFPNTYGNVYRLREPAQTVEYHNLTAGKTKLAAWFVSNCVTESGRERFVRDMQKLIRIDIYGDCGPLRCERKYQWDTCYKMLERDYKFYLSFENSLCQDYVTEKFFDVLQVNIVPVVFGFGNYTATAPPGSYINALDFQSPEHLVSYLLYLDKNDTAYMEYFHWRKYHHFPSRWDKLMKPFCDLCERLHTDHTTKTYDLHEWFFSKSHCRSWRGRRLEANDQALDYPL